MIMLRPTCAYIVFLVASNSLAGQVQLPAGTVLPAMLSSSMDTHKNKPGDRITARVMQDAPLGGHNKVVAGSLLVGHIIDVQPSSLTLKFDRLVIHKRAIEIQTSLRALASMMEIHDARLPSNAAGADRGSSELDWNTVQVGGDVVYGRRGGPVIEGSQIVGHSLFGDGVLATPVAAPGSKCPASIGAEAPQAFWLFSASACGTYGYADLWIAHAGRSNPLGTIVLASHGRIRIRAGSGMLLRVAGD